MQVLYEDNHLILINKVAGEIVQGDKTGDQALSEEVALYLSRKYNKPGKAFIGVIHRLDRPVSGVVAFAKTSKALTRMNELFRNREIEKVYWALVEGRPLQQEGILIHYLRKNEEQNRSYARNSPGEGYSLCELAWKQVVQTEQYTLLELRPLSGRHHQIRVQLASSGWSIRGDVKYGAKRGNPDRSICLHARSLSFLHPVSKAEICINAALPKGQAWAPLKEYAEFFSS
jgi:23S rRNA pseudouridine1911/1915/1917 synthase